MKEIKLSSIDKFHLKNLVDSIKYLKNSENAKQWLASNNYRLLIQLFKIEDEYANFKIEDEILENFLFKNLSIYKLYLNKNIQLNVFK